MTKLKIVEWWIMQGATFDKEISDIEVGESIKPTFLRHYGLDTNPRPYYETVNIAPLDSVQITTIEQHGFTIKTLGGENPLLDVKYSGNDLTLKKIQSLETIATNITWFSLAQTNVTDEWLATVANFQNLTRLQLEKTSISDKGIALLSDLKHIETLNLYGTNVTNSCLTDIQEMKSLKRVYLWKTKVAATEAKTLEDNNEALKIILGKVR